jgi:hypothetical protein
MRLMDKNGSLSIEQKDLKTLIQRELGRNGSVQLKASYVQ